MRFPAKIVDRFADPHLRRLADDNDPHERQCTGIHDAHQVRRQVVSPRTGEAVHGDDAVQFRPFAGLYGLLSPQYQAFAFGQPGRHRDGTAVWEVPENGVRDPRVAFGERF